MYKEEEIESEIIEALMKEITEMEILSYQNDLHDFTCTHPVGTILVSYHSTTPVAQGTRYTDEVRFGIDVIYRNINTHVEAFSVLRKVRDVMNTINFKLADKNFLNIIGDEWIYSLIFVRNFVWEPGI